MFNIIKKYIHCHLSILRLTRKMKTKQKKIKQRNEFNCRKFIWDMILGSRIKGVGIQKERMRKSQHKCVLLRWQLWLHSAGTTEKYRIFNGIVLRWSGSWCSNKVVEACPCEEVITFILRPLLHILPKEEADWH